MVNHLDIILDERNNEASVQFVEIEVDGYSIDIGERIARADGLTALRITGDDLIKAEALKQQAIAELARGLKSND